ncbi:serine/threonine-protein kinase [Aquisphaera insulae]|uniref:serine/threonine-protein kinase n=1 Tax=Aquisphaera insulae TaxID=2712864 RepID=UPI0013EB6BFD|nr:serine/threonine-protein kinase [Aquisphaera insulae]
MRTTRGDTASSLACGELERLISICDRFDRALRTGERPAIEEFLASDRDSDELLERLILLELDFLMDAGYSPSPDEYRARFTDRDGAIEAAFGTWHTSSVGVRSSARPEGTLAQEAPTHGLRVEPLANRTRAGLDDSTAASGSTLRNLSGAAGPGITRGGRAKGGAPPSLEPSSVPRYELIEKHAQGGVGEVWLARDHVLDREVALKQLHPEKAADPSLRARFLREAWVTGQLQHPGIVPIFDLARNDQDGRTYYTMRFIAGRTLADSARSQHASRARGEAGELGLRELLGAFVQACQVMAYAHSRGVVHRDLKGRNVVLGDFGEVMVLDWGMAKVLGSKEPGAAPAKGSPSLDAAAGRWTEELTIQGEVLGTPSYMPPEQAMGFLERVNVRSDVYGLGAILYEILAGEPPFRGTSSEVLWRVVHEQPTPPRRRGVAVPPALEAICLKCLAKAPEARYTTAGEVAEEVRRFLADEPVSAHRERWSGRARRWIGRHQTLAAVLVSGLLITTVCLAISAALLMVAGNREARARRRSETNLRLAMNAIDRLYSRVGEDPVLRSRGLEKHRQELLTEARSLFEQLLPEDGAGPVALAQSARSDLRLAAMTHEVGNFPAAILIASRARSTFEGLMRLEPSNRDHRAGAARAFDLLGGHYQSNHQPTEAREALARANALWGSLIHDDPTSQEFRSGHIISRNKLGRLLCLAIHDPPAERALLSPTLDDAQRLAHEAPDSAEVLDQLAESHLLLGCSWATEDIEKARPHFEASLAIREQLAAKHPDHFDFRSELLDSCVLIAARYSNARAADEVASLFKRVRKISEHLVSEHPDVPTLAENRCLIEILHAIHLVQSGEHSRAVSSVELALARAPHSGITMLYAACCLSTASESARLDPASTPEVREELTRRYQLRAMEFLREAYKVGLFVQPHQLAGLKSADPDLAPLRGRDDFQRLVAEIEAGTSLAPH